jgi:hypothetical protein
MLTRMRVCALALLLSSVALAACGTWQAQAQPGDQGIVLPTPPPMPTSAPLPPTATPPPAPGSGPSVAAVGTLAQSDFSNSGELGQWRVLDSAADVRAPSVWSVEDGRLLQVSDADGLPSNYYTALVRGDASWRNYTVAGSFYSTGNDAVGLVLRASDSGYYAFIWDSLSPTAGILSFLRFDPQTSQFARIARVDGPPLELRRWYQLTAIAQGDRFTFSIDGKPVLEANDSALTSGGAGVLGKAQGSLAVDNFRVQALQAGQ